jgi:hypothetical protein
MKEENHKAIHVPVGGLVVVRMIYGAILLIYERRGRAEEAATQAAKIRLESPQYVQRSANLAFVDFGDSSGNFRRACNTRPMEVSSSRGFPPPPRYNKREERGANPEMRLRPSFF